MLDNIAADSVLGSLLTSTSKRSIFRAFTFIVAFAISALENLGDILFASIEDTVSKAAPATPAWLQDQVLKFQYSDTNPQVIQFQQGTFAPGYPVVDETLRIITRCSVTTNLSNSVIVKAATGEPPAALTTPQLNALQSYVNEIGIAGVNYTVLSDPSDKLYVKADVYYQGTYSAVIQQNVIDAIEAFLSSIPFNGQVKVLDLERAIRAVEGVNDVLLVDVKARANATALASAGFLVQNNQVIGRLWNTVSGYIVGETTASNTLSDTLNFIAE
jgi:hypothetical protein